MHYPYHNNFVSLPLFVNNRIITQQRTIWWANDLSPKQRIRKYDVGVGIRGDTTRDYENHKVEWKIQELLKNSPKQLISHHSKMKAYSHEFCLLSGPRSSATCRVVVNVTSPFAQKLLFRNRDLEQFKTRPKLSLILWRHNQPMRTAPITLSLKVLQAYWGRLHALRNLSRIFTS